MMPCNIHIYIRKHSVLSVTLNLMCVWLYNMGSHPPDQRLVGHGLYCFILKYFLFCTNACSIIQIDKSNKLVSVHLNRFFFVKTFHLIIYERNVGLRAE